MWECCISSRVLFYVCAFQMYPVCVVFVVTSDGGLFLLYSLVTRVKVHVTGGCVDVCRNVFYIRHHDVVFILYLDYLYTCGMPCL